MDREKKIKAKLIKPLDYVIVAIAITLVTFSLIYTFTNRAHGARVIVTTLEGEFVYDLNSDTTLGAPGPLGVSVLRVKDGVAWFESSPCDNQICVMSHPIQHNAHFSACLPNQVFMRVEAENETSLNQITDSLDVIGY